MSDFVSVQSVVLRRSEVLLVKKSKSHPMKKEDADTDYNVVVLFSNGNKEVVFHGKSDPSDQFIKDLRNALR